MKRFIIFSVILSLVGLSSFGQAMGKTVATVNLIKMEAITSTEVENKLSQLKTIGGRAGMPQQEISRDKVVESIINRVLINQAAERDGVKVPDSTIEEALNAQRQQFQQSAGKAIGEAEFRRIVAERTGYSWEEYKKQIRQQLVQERYVMSRKQGMFEKVNPPTENQIQEYYNSNASQFPSPEYVRISQVFIPKRQKSQSEIEDARKRIREAYQKYKSGEMTFNDIVLKYSEDQNSKFKKGDTGYITRENTQVRQVYGPTFFNSVFELEKGEVSNVIESNVGFHIVKVTEHEDAQILKLNDPVRPGSKETLRDYLRNMMYRQKQQEVYQKATEELIQELKDEAEIVRYDQ